MSNSRADELREQAERCRRLAKMVTNYEVAESLLRLAEEFEVRAKEREEQDPCNR